MTPTTAVLVALALVLANAFFVASEFAIVKVRPTRLQALAKGGSRRARAALRISERLDAYLSANQLGVTLASIALGWVAEPAFAALIQPTLARVTQNPAVLHSVAAALAFFCVTFLHTVVGELAPKSIAIQRAEETALALAQPLHVFYVALYPFIALLNGGARVVLRLLGLKPAAESSDVAGTEELKLVVAASHAHGLLDESTAALVDHALDFRDRPVRTVMTPRPELLALDVDTPLDQAIRITAESAYSRFPVLSRARGRDHLIGFVHGKDLYAHVAGVKTVTSLRQLVREPILIPETTSVDRVRRLMQRKRTHVAFVLDEYANFVGMASMEDLLEELVGPIDDEQDDPHPQQFQERPDGSFELDGAMALSDAERRISFEGHAAIPGIDSVGGYIFAVLEHPPQVGDKVRIGRAHEAEVLEVRQLRVRRLLITPLRPPPDPSTETSGETSGADPDDPVGG